LPPSGGIERGKGGICHSSLLPKKGAALRERDGMIGREEGGSDLEEPFLRRVLKKGQ